MIGINTAAGFLSLLDENEAELHQYALQKLNELVGDFWAEIANSIGKIEVLYEDEEFEYRNLAALVASKVYYHLGEFTDSMTFALGAGDLFDIQAKNEYVDTLIAKCFDEYIKLRKSSVDDNEEVTIDSRLESIIELMFKRCFSEKGYKEALGIALESRRMDKIEEAIMSSENPEEMLDYCLDVCRTLVTNRDFRHKVYALIVELYKNLDTPDYLTICRILVFLDNAEQTSETLVNLLNGSEDDSLLAYQIAFDLYSNSTQQFLTKVRNNLPSLSKKAPESEGDAMEVDNSDSFIARNRKVQEILSGEVTIKLYLEFLHRNNQGDLAILKTSKSNVDARHSVTHSALIFANALMNAGTTKDSFLRDNLEWLSRATNWAKFSATAGLGVIHKGHLKEGLNLLAPYLPGSGNTPSPYSEGGALYGLGLIHANHGDSVIPYLRNALTNSNGDNIIQHGACLGLGTAGMATGSSEVYEDLRNVLYSDDANAGEAAGLAMGLVMLGTAEEIPISEMLAHAHETQHEKIIRGLAMGMAMIMYGREAQADALIDQLILDKDPILRYGGMYTIAMAYCGTANNNAIRRLLHIAVSDVSDDVRRAAVTCLGFLLSGQPEQCPKMVSLLAESYNPHVRYGATIAVGIACAGTAMPEALDLLIPMATDTVDFVRQGALIALAMVLVQVTRSQEPRVERVRKIFEEKLTTKGEQPMAKFGAILAQGIIDAGGRNCTIALHSISGHQSLLTTVGLAISLQYWYWYPLTHFMSLALTPTTMITLNKDLKMPKFSFTSNCKPSMFAYPPKSKVSTSSAPTKVATAVLSTTKKALAKKDSKLRASQSDAMQIDDNKNDEKKTEENEEKKEENKQEEKKKKKEEPRMEIKQNPSRITLGQLKYISCDVDTRYRPIRMTNKGDLFGIVMLKDLKPGEPEEFVENEDSNDSAPKQDESK